MQIWRDTIRPTRRDIDHEKQRLQAACGDLTEAHLIGSVAHSVLDDTTNSLLRVYTGQLGQADTPTALCRQVARMRALIVAYWEITDE